MKRIHCWSVALLIAIASGLNYSHCCGADREKTDGDRSKTSNPSAQVEQKTAFLGLMIGELHPAFMSHLPGIGSSGQGLLVESVGNDSPAAKAGIKVHDILMTYDDQKLYSPDQFAKLVSNDRVGREVKLGLIRAGSSETLKVQLGERSAEWNEPRFAEEMNPGNQPRFGWLHDLWGRPHFWGNTPNRTYSNTSNSANTSWNQFDSMTVKKLDNGRFHASIAYTDKEGKIEKHEYEGTREEIRKRIDADKNVLPSERIHLLRGLDMQDYGVPNNWLPDQQQFEF